MKKFAVLLLSVLLTGTVFAGSITVTSPTGSTQWVKGNTYNITWTASNCQIQDYKINIFMNAIDPANFVEQLTVSGTTSKSWYIPVSYQAGNYVIRVKTSDNLCVGDSPVFQVVEPQQQTPTITVTAPTGGSSWEKGSTYAITWTKTGDQSGSVKINIFRDSIDQSNFVEQLTGPNNGSKSWSIPVSYQTGNYYLRVKPDDSSCHGDSPMFQITDHPVQPESTIEITNPHSGTVWRKGITYSITWNKTGQQSSDVKIGVYKDSISPANLVDQMTGLNNGAKSWGIPAGYQTGTYYLRITTDDNLVTADSEGFKIKPKFQIVEEMVPVPLHGEIEIIKPSTSSNWKEGASHQIKWKNKFTKNKGFTIALYNHSGSKKLKDIKTYLPLNVKIINNGSATPSDTSTLNWYIPKGTYKWPGNYRIRITRADGKASGLSDMFHIQIGTQVKTYTINGTFGNYCWRSYWAKNGEASLNQMKAQVGDCTAMGGGGVGWAGYANHLYAVNNSLYYGDVWRTHAVFDLSQFAGKGVILKAKLKVNKSYYPAGANCELRVWRLLAPLADAFNINSERVETPLTDMTAIAQSWMGFPGENYGIMFTGPDESFQHNTNQCKIFLMSVKLEIEFLESQ